MRLQKYMAHAQVASRRKSEEIILAKRVKVNGKIIDKPGFIVSEDDIVEVDGRPIHIKSTYDYFILNKPLGVVSTASDDLNRNSVVDLINTSNRIYPVGRLDMDSRGLIILTNDGRLTEILTHPSYNIEKTYRVRLGSKVDEQSLQKLRDGIMLGSKKTNPAKIRVLRNSNKPLIEVKISEGRNRQVRKMFEYIGYEITDLQRIQFGEFYLGNLEEGKYRKCSPREHKYINYLKEKYDK